MYFPFCSSEGSQDEPYQHHPAPPSAKEQISLSDLTFPLHQQQLQLRISSLIFKASTTFNSPENKAHHICTN